MPKPTYFINIDWNNDGILDTAYDDISADVRALDATHGKDRELSKAQAGTLTLTVKNADHKYSPPNASSILNQGGRTLNKSHRAEVIAAYPWDTFAGVNGVTLANHVPTNDSSWVWSQLSGSMEIDNDQIKSTAGAAVTYISAADWNYPVDLSIQVDFKKGANDDCILIWRLIDANNYIYLKTTDTQLQIREVITGVDSLVAAVTHTWTVDDYKRVRVMLHGDEIYVFVANYASATDLYFFSLLLKGTSLFNESGNACGIGGPSIHADARYWNFGLVRHLGYGKLNKIVPVPNPTEKVVYLECNDDFFKLANTEIFLLNDIISTNDMWGHISYILDAVQNIQDVYNTAFINSIYDTGVDVTASKKAFWGVKALEQLQKFEAEENGFFYQDVMGNWRFEGRGHRAAYPHTTSQLTISDVSTDPVYFSEMQWMGWDDDIINFAMASAYLAGEDYYYTRVAGVIYYNRINPQEIWRCAECDIFDQIIGIAEKRITASTISIPANSSKELYFEVANFDAIGSIETPDMVYREVYIHGQVDYGPFIVGQIVMGYVTGARALLNKVKGDVLIGRMLAGPLFNAITDPVAPYLGNAESPVVMTAPLIEVINLADIRANAQADGLGADRTDHLTVTVSIDNPGGKGGKITLFNNDSGTIWVTKLRLRGDGYKYQPKIYAATDDAASIDSYGEKRVNVDCDLLLTRTEIQALTDDIISKGKDKKAMLSIVVPGATINNLLAILNLQVSDRITLTATSMGLSEAFYINKKQFIARDMDKRLDCVFLLEQVVPTEFQDNLFLLDDATQGLLETNYLA